jgi:hypothetical protein
MSLAKQYLQSLPDFSAMIAAVTGKASAPPDETDKRRDELAAYAETAYFVASADGSMSEEEMNAIANRIEDLTDGQITMAITGMLLGTAAAKAAQSGRDALLAQVAKRLDTEAKREAGFTVAAHASWKGGGIGVQEGLALQAIARAFGWEINHMHKLLGRARG